MFRSPVFDAVVIIVILLLFAGPKRLPMLSRSIGESIKEFKGGIGDSKETQAEIHAANPAPTAPAAAPQAAAETAAQQQAPQQQSPQSAPEQRS